jgi:hypothetical protein
MADFRLATIEISFERSLAEKFPIALVQENNVSRAPAEVVLGRGGFLAVFAARNDKRTSG